MTKIAKTNITVRGELHQVEIHYTRERQFFYRGIPEEVLAITQFRNQHYASERELTQALRIALEEYHEKVKTQRKMILYSLYGSSTLVMNRIEQGMYCGVKDNVSRKFQTTSSAKYLFGFDFDIVLEVSAQKIEYYFMNDEGIACNRMIRPLGCTMHLIEWTPQREHFFRDMAAQMQKLVLSVSEFFDKPDMLELIDNQTVRLLK